MYYLDLGWQGGLVVFAKSLDEAFSKMKNIPDWKSLEEKDKRNIEEQEISEDLFVEFSGDY